MRINRFEYTFVGQFKQKACFAREHSHTDTHTDGRINQLNAPLSFGQVPSTIDTEHSLLTLLCCCCCCIPGYVCMRTVVSSHLISRVSKCTTVIGLTLRLFASRPRSGNNVCIYASYGVWFGLYKSQSHTKPKRC